MSTEQIFRKSAMAGRSSATPSPDSGRRIRLYRGTHFWMADWSEHHDRVLLVDLFETDQIPTCFFTHADGESVRHTVQGLNPQSVVVVV